MRLKQRAVKQPLHQRTVQLAFQHAPGERLRIAYAYLRRLPRRKHPGQRLWKIVIRDGQRRAQAQGRHAGGHALHEAALVDQLNLYVLFELLACGRQPHAASARVYQPPAEMLLQPVNLLRHGGLGQMQALCCARVAAQPGHFQKGKNLCVQHRISLRRKYNINL